MFIESGVVSEGSVNGVLSGKHYNRSIFCHKTMYEAMQRLRFETFFNQLVEEKQERIIMFATEMMNCFPEKRFHDCVGNEMMEEICDDYETYVAESSSKSRTFAFWSMYIKAIGKRLPFINYLDVKTGVRHVTKILCCFL